MRFGLLLPHFSDWCTRRDLVCLSARVEELGFDSVWARDNLAYTPEEFDPPGSRFVDPFVALSAVAGRTERLGLGTAVVIPFRHPMVTAQLVGSLDWASGGRLEIGLGPGTPTAPFAATRIPYEARIERFEETARLLRALRGRGAGHDSLGGDPAEAPHLDPVPRATMTLWYGGSSDASARRAAEHCDGIISGRCPFARHDELIAGLRRHEERRGRPGVRVASIPFISVADTREAALRRIAGPLERLKRGLSARWRRPFETVEDLAGALVVGSPADCAEQLRQFADRAMDLVVFDLRLVMEDYEEMVARVGEEILPLTGRP